MGVLKPCVCTHVQRSPLSITSDFGTWISNFNHVYTPIAKIDKKNPTTDDIEQLHIQN